MCIDSNVYKVLKMNLVMENDVHLFDTSNHLFAVSGDWHLIYMEKKEKYTDSNDGSLLETNLPFTMKMCPTRKS